MLIASLDIRFLTRTYSGEKALLRWWVCALTISTFVVIRTHTALRLRLRRWLVRFVLLVKASFLNCQMAKSRYVSNIRFTERNRYWFTWEIAVIGIGFRAGNLFYTSHWSRRESTLCGEAWMSIVCFWMWSTILWSHPTRYSIQTPMRRSELHSYRLQNLYTTWIVKLVELGGHLFILAKNQFCWWRTWSTNAFHDGDHFPTFVWDWDGLPKLLC